MEINNFAIKLTMPRIHIEALGCMHIGNINFDQEKFESRLKAIRDEPERYVIFMGDLHDAIYPSTFETRYDPDTIDYRFWPPPKGYAWIEKKLKRIADKIIGIHTGNHDDRLRMRDSDHNYVREICENLEVKYLDWSAFTKLKFFNARFRKKYIVNSAHGAYMGARLGGNINRIEDLAGAFDADIILRSHTHHKGGAKHIYLALENGKIVEKQRVIAATGSFFKSYQAGKPGYAERADKKPVSTGSITVTLLPREGKMELHL